MQIRFTDSLIHLRRDRALDGQAFRPLDDRRDDRAAQQIAAIERFLPSASQRDFQKLVFFAPRELHTNVPEVAGEIAKVIADDQKKRIATWSATDQLMSDTKRKLGDKYKTNF